MKACFYVDFVEWFLQTMRELGKRTLPILWIVGLWPTHQHHRLHIFKHRDDQFGMRNWLVSVRDEKMVSGVVYILAHDTNHQDDQHKRFIRKPWSISDGSRESMSNATLSSPTPRQKWQKYVICITVISDRMRPPTHTWGINSRAVPVGIMRSTEDSNPRPLPSSKVGQLLHQNRSA